MLIMGRNMHDSVEYDMAPDQLPLVHEFVMELKRKEVMKALRAIPQENYTVARDMLKDSGKISALDCRSYLIDNGFARGLDLADRMVEVIASTIF